MDWKLERCVQYLYVLELANGKFYVGQAKDPDRRLRKHFNGSGSEWTRLHPPVKELMRKCLEDGDYRAGEQAENEVVLQLMRQCSGLMKPDTHLGENARQIEVSDDQTTSFLFR